MRRIVLGEILVVAQHLMSVPRLARGEVISHWVEQAHCADKYRKKMGKEHVLWGNGSLIDRVDPRPVSKPSTFSDLGFLVALGAVLEAVVERSSAIECHK